MAKVSNCGVADRPVEYSSTKVIIDPKTSNLDKTMRDLLHISNLAIKRFPNAIIESITLKERFAIVRASIPNMSGPRSITLRLHENKGIWRIKYQIQEQLQNSR